MRLDDLFSRVGQTFFQHRRFVFRPSSLIPRRVRFLDLRIHHFSFPGQLQKVPPVLFLYRTQLVSCEFYFFSDGVAVREPLISFAHSTFLRIRTLGFRINQRVL